jgi:hypothetical protein
MKHELVHYRGWDNCVRLSNDLVDLIVTTEVGPRIIRYGFVGEPNEFCEFTDQMGQKGGDEWRIYGGHRLWHAPEQMPRTYYPDNSSVGYEIKDGVLRLTQPLESTTGIEKELDIYLHTDSSRVLVSHRLRNKGVSDIELAPWALTVLAPGGTAIVPLPPRQTHAENLSPVSSLALWAYTDFSDPRWELSPRYILLKFDRDGNGPQKVGISVPSGWAAFAREGHLFLKQFMYSTSSTYPDLGSCVEVFTNQVMTELETLGPLTRIAPGKQVDHIETWDLVSGVKQPATENEVDDLLPSIADLMINQEEIR